jgi:phenylpropionate dioxygenase-like ring-hydroxylating dioxygenase large terminal subunit
MTTRKQRGSKAMGAKKQSRNEEIEHLIENGLRNLWYAVAPSGWIGDHPVGLTVLGDEIVAWRGEDGKVRILEDRCAHRGAKLSLGSVSGNLVACGYHGVQTDGDGVIAAVPAFPSCPLVGRKAVRSYPSVEQSGCIWAYFGDGEPIPFVIPEDLSEGHWNGFLTTQIWNCNYRYAYENLVDPMHGSYLHAKSHTLAWGSKEDRMKVEETERGFIIAREGQRGVNFDWTEFVDTGGHWIRLDIPYPAKAGPGGEFRIVGFVTPLDTERCQVFFWRMRKVEGWQRDMWRFLFKARWEERHYVPLSQDQAMLEAMPKNGKPQEMLYQHDIGVARWRQIMIKAARNELPVEPDARSAADQQAAE